MTWTQFFSIFKIALILFSLFLTSCTFFYIYWRFYKKIKPKKGEYRWVGYGNFFSRIFVEFPRQLMYDKLNRDPDEFREYGVHVIAGEQGKGKTCTGARMMLRFQKMYPKLKIRTNFDFKHEDGVIYDWRDLMQADNGIYGEICFIDEVQNWFNSSQSKDFPIEMMTIITQQRKERKMILCTSQVFTRVAKPIREQTYFLYQPFTLRGCLTIVPKFKLKIKADNGNPEKKKFKGFFFFVHNSELRESFDTYRKIERLSKEGFKSADEHL